MGTNKTATFVKNLDNFTGDARLYKLDPPMDGNQYVVVSATIVPFSGPETCIFPSNEDGKVTSWGELYGSFRGGLDHQQALENAGYERKLVEV